MRIAWFSPFTKKSAIGRFSRSVTDRLAQRAEVDLWLAEESELHETSLRIIPKTSWGAWRDLLPGYDLAVYNLGDHLSNHRHIYEMCRQHAGVIIQHDYVMHHFFVGYYADVRKNWRAYVEVMRHWYNIEDVADDDWTGLGSLGRVWETDDVMRYPLFEQAIWAAHGVVVHSDFMRDAVSKVTSSPVTKIPLAYEIENRCNVPARTELDIPPGRMLVVTIGNLNENKRVDVMLRALAANRELSERLIYVVVGACDSSFGQRTVALCRELGLEGSVRFTDYVSDQVLNAYLRYCDICVNLRWPAMEGASASCIEQMLAGKALIVTDTGFYSELPDVCVRKVRPEHEESDLTQHLRELVDDEQGRRGMGEGARRFAKSNFSPAGYAEALLEFAVKITSLRPLFGLAQRVADELGSISVHESMDILGTVSRESNALFIGDCNAPVLKRDR